MSSSRKLPSKKGGIVSELESHVGFWLRFVSNHVSGRFSRLLEERGLTVSEWVALRRLLANGPSTTSSFVETLGMTKGAVTKVMDRLRRKGFVTRTLDPEDRRIQWITLTHSGSVLVPKLAALADENDLHFFGHLSSKERKIFVDILREIVRQQELTRIPIA